MANTTPEQTTATRLLFDYRNHRGDLHRYLVEPREGGLRFGSIKQGQEPHWLLHADCIERDGQPHEGVRSFKLWGIMNLQEVER